MLVTKHELSNILVIDDDPSTCKLVRDYLEKHNYRVKTGKDGHVMTALLAQNKFDVIILDVMLPGKNGFELCQQIRLKSNVPVIMLSAMNELTDKVLGLELGADDYLPKPFEPRELLARVRSALRRNEAGRGDVSAINSRGKKVEVAHWIIDLALRQLTDPDGIIVTLTAAEFDLLAAFVRHPQSVLSRDQLLEFTTGREILAFDRSIDILVSRLRGKMSDQAVESKLLKTIRGGGYYFVPKVKVL